MWKYYNANVLGKSENDCTIRAISCATNKSWDYVYEHLSDIAQSQGTMMDDRHFIINYLNKRYKRILFRGKVGEVSLKYPNNILLITMKGHITCSKYGNIYDSFDCTNRTAEYVWKVE
ncbi:MAG: hypothetical protein HFJ46_02815 [Clostridia bacterium]|jgi:hypothetical protein|nr:hypothetical protein [Clostridia bacterium]